MKQLLYSLCFLLPFISMAQDQTKLEWHTNVEEAQQLAKEENKIVLLYFTGSDWCAPCKMLKEDFWNSEAFSAMAEKFVLVELDEPRRMDIITPEQRIYNRSVGRKYNKRNSFPNIVALDARGRVIDEIGGYTMLRETDRHFAFLNKVLSR